MISGLIFYDAQTTQYFSNSFVLVVLGSMSLVVAYLVVASLRVKNKDIDYQLKSHEGLVVKVDFTGTQGLVEIIGETWKFQTPSPVKVGDRLKIEKREGLLLIANKI